MISQRLARVTDDLCDLFCNQIRRVTRLAETALENYLADNQEKTDEILRRYATLETLLNSDCPEAEQLQAVRHTVTARPDLCESPAYTPSTVAKTRAVLCGTSSSTGARSYCGFSAS